MKPREVVQRGVERNAIKEASELVAKLDDNPLTRDAIQKIYEDKGITRESVAEALARALQAKRVFLARAGKNDPGELVLTDLDDIKIQLEAVKIAVDLFGDRAPIKTQSENTRINVKVNIAESNEMESAMKKYLTKKLGKKTSSTAQVKVIEAKIKD